MKKSALFKQGAGPSTDRPRSGRQSIRGRISNPIPINDPLDPTQLPVTTHMASASVDISRQSPGADDDDDGIPKRQSPPRASRVASREPEPAYRKSMLDVEPGSSPVPTPRYKTPEPAIIPDQSTLVTPSSKAAASPMAAQPTKASLALEPPRPGPSPSSGSLAPSATASATASASGSGVSGALRQPTNRSSTLRYSQLSGNSGTGQSNASSFKPQRKQSTLRGAFSKLFGRRKKTPSETSPSPAATSRERTPQHRSVRSDPTILGRATGSSQPHRTSSLPLSEYDRALRSHSIGANDLTAAASASRPSQADDKEEADNSSRKRAATAGSRMLFSERGRTGTGGVAGDVFNGGGEFVGLSPRPASTHGRGSSHHRISAAGLIIGGTAEATGHDTGLGLGLGPTSAGLGGGSQPGSYNPDEIGRAITSDVQGGTEFGHRRRSRSLSGIHDITVDTSSGRRRSDEIRYWRESYDPAFLSPVSSAAQYVDAEDGPAIGDDNAHEVPDQPGMDEEDEEDAIVEQVAVDRYPEDKETAAMSLSPQSLPETPSEQQDPRQKTPQTPPQPFAFGSLANLGTYSGMKITQAATLDSRMGVLENRMQRIERMVEQLCHAVPGFNGPLTATPTTDPTRRSAAQSAGSSPDIPSVPAIPRSFMTGDAPAGGSSSHPALLAPSSQYASSRHSGYSVESDMPSHMSFGDGQTYVGSLHPPSSSATHSQSIPAPSSGLSPHAALSSTSSMSARPTSTSTVRGVTSLPAIGSPGSSASTTDLLAQLESERAVRQTLEAQVRKLNDRVNNLSTTMFAMVRGDPVPKQRPSREPLATLSTTNLRERAAAAGSSAGSVSHSATGLKSENTSPPLGKRYEPETESEGFQTPLEEVRSLQMSEDYNNYSDYEAGMSDDTSRKETGSKADDTQGRKRAPRTLSLGQLTLGKSVRT